MSQSPGHLLVGHVVSALERQGKATLFILHFSYLRQTQSAKWNRYRTPLKTLCYTPNSLVVSPTPSHLYIDHTQSSQLDLFSFSPCGFPRGERVHLGRQPWTQASFGLPSGCTTDSADHRATGKRSPRGACTLGRIHVWLWILGNITQITILFITMVDCMCMLSLEYTAILTTHFYRPWILQYYEGQLDWIRGRNRWLGFSRR